ncbi:hypothetical protein BDZ89DRAFT_1143387 [Hymenopellis radicata]|nr:hypothetical protein BDZ89DRAFT_1143387 [Hymenopellis radicata]
MAFTTYRETPDILRTLRENSVYKNAVARAHARPVKQFSNIAVYTEPSAIARDFVIDANSNEHFVFVNQRCQGAEQVFIVRGTISEVCLPPLVQNPSAPQRLGQVHQSVTLISYTSDKIFNDSGKAASNLLEFLVAAVPVSVNRSAIVDDSGRTKFLKFKTPFLSPCRRVHPDDVITVPSAYDPSGTISYDDIGNLVMSRDNVVAFNSLKKRTDGGWSRIRGVDPTIFRPGSIVEAGVTFRLLKQRHDYIIVCHLDSLTLIWQDGPKLLRELRAKQRTQARALPKKDRDDGSEYEGDDADNCFMEVEQSQISENPNGGQRDSEGVYQFGTIRATL